MTLPKRRLIIIHNPTSGIRNKNRFSKALLRLADTDCEVEILKTNGPGHATEMTRELVARNDPDIVLVAAGGDGTVSEILNGLEGGEVPLGVIPLGTANVLARELGLGVSINKAIKTLAEAEPVPVYSATANEKRFLLMAGAGYDSLTVAALRPGEKKRFGALAYVLAAFRAVTGFRDMEFEVVVNGKSYAAASVVITKVRYYGGPFVIAPEGGIENPRLDVLLLKNAGLAAAFRYGAALLLNRLSQLSDVEILETNEEVLVTSSRVFPCQLDGDICLKTPLHIALNPTPLRILRAPEN
ncbi:MAG: diacylglycerol kinase family protein [Sneathiella sp.]